MSDLKEAVLYAIGSRLLVIVLQFLANVVTPDHEPGGAFKSPLIELEKANYNDADRAVHFFLQGLNRWDSQYFTHIAQFGYTYEHLVAFFPFYPWLMNLVASVLEDSFGTYLSRSSLLLISGVLISNISFVLSAIVLFYLTQHLFSDRALPLRVAKLYSFNPASIFFSACYTESLFAFLTFSGLYLLEKDFDTLSTIFFALSSITRSNATLIPIFYYYKIKRRYQRRKYYLGLIMRTGLACAGNLAVQLYFWEKFCFPHHIPKFPAEVEQYAEKMGYHVVGESASEWCFKYIPLSYSYVQDKYWNVRLFGYWETKQLPNFMLALPVMVMTINFCRDHGERLRRYCVHSVILGAIFVFFANVQVATRVMMSASPAVFWTAGGSRKNVTLVWLYFIWYFLVGIFLHSNFLPWT